MPTISVYLQDTEYELLLREARKRGYDRVSRYVAEIIRNHLKNLKEAEMNEGG